MGLMGSCMHIIIGIYKCIVQINTIIVSYAIVIPFAHAQR